MSSITYSNTSKSTCLSQDIVLPSKFFSETPFQSKVIFHTPNSSPEQVPFQCFRLWLSQLVKWCPNVVYQKLSNKGVEATLLSHPTVPWPSHLIKLYHFLINESNLFLDACVCLVSYWTKHWILRCSWVIMWRWMLLLLIHRLSIG